MSRKPSRAMLVRQIEDKLREIIWLQIRKVLPDINFMGPQPGKKRSLEKIGFRTFDVKGTKFTLEYKCNRRIRKFMDLKMPVGCTVSNRFPKLMSTRGDLVKTIWHEFRGYKIIEKTRGDPGYLRLQTKLGLSARLKLLEKSDDTLADTLTNLSGISIELRY